MYRIFHILALIAVMSGAGLRMDSWVITPSPSPEDTLGGTTLGQTGAGPVSSEAYEGMLGFWNAGPEPVLCIEMPDTVWDIDSVDVEEIVSMEAGQQLSVGNCSNVHIVLGLKFVETDTVTWAISYGNSRNRFVLRARFTEDETPPESYDVSYDFIEDIVTWSNETYFGGLGYDIAIADSRNMWLQFVAPSSSSTYGPNRITIQTMGRMLLP